MSGDDSNTTKLIFVGTGVSTAIPVMGHLDRNCACKDAIENPSTSKNRRNNVSILLQSKPSATDAAKTATDKCANVLVDCGKTFRDAYFRILARHGITHITSLLLTHDHMDAIAGVDDLRDLQYFAEAGEFWKCQYYIPTYLSTTTLGTLKSQVPYIIDESIHRGKEAALQSDWASAPLPSLKNDGIRERRATCLDLFEVDDVSVSQIHVAGLEGVPTYALPVIHGAGYQCLGFAFGAGTTQELNASGRSDCVVYLSDVSEVPEETMRFLKSIPRIDVLVVDVLDDRASHFSHFCLPQAMELVTQLDPTRAYGVGMYCGIVHDTYNAKLSSFVDDCRSTGKTKNLQSFELAFDGLELDVSLS